MLLILLLLGVATVNRDQVAERTLFLWNNEHLVSKGCFSRAYTHSILPVIYGYAELFGQELDERRVGLAIHRRRTEGDLEGILVHPHHARPAGAWRDADREGHAGLVFAGVHGFEATLNDALRVRAVFGLSKRLWVGARAEVESW